ncbi:hypothetical protein NC652_017883 [Populus alba x Populus x berolinensis]|nr:hypothetical protein NC652_017883 [Populus alba x Populus x berolinensis]
MSVSLAAGFNNLTSIDYHNQESEESMVSSIGSDKATILPYNEIREATSNFSRSLIIGQGSYGLVYLGKIRGTIELIGYVAGGESLFLVYEFAQNGALSNHLHNPALRGLEFPTSYS